MSILFVKWISSLNKQVTWNMLVKFIICMNITILAYILYFEYTYVQILEKQKDELKLKVELQEELIEIQDIKIKYLKSLQNK